MLIPDSEEIIARFIGMFGMLDVDPRFHSQVVGADRQAHGVEPAPSEAMAWGGMTAAYDPRLQNPQLRYANDVFEIEKVRSHPPATHKVTVDDASFAGAIHPGRAMQGGASDHAALLQQAHQSASMVASTVVYDDAPTDSLLARYQQTTTTDDRDHFTLDSSVDPLSVVDAVTREFQRMVEIAQSVRMSPAIPSNPSEIEAKLTIAAASATHHDVQAGDENGQPAGPEVATETGDGWSATAMALTTVHAPGAPLTTPIELEGTFVDGVRTSEGPALKQMLEDFHASSSANATDWTVDTGSNTLTTEAMIRNIGEMGRVTTVMGNWYETNSIRQFNFHSDVDDIEGFSPGAFQSGGTRAMNVAEFNRIDATPVNAFALPDFGFLPSNYHVDVMEGNLQITSFLSQLNLMLDGDQVALTSLQHKLSLSTGGNEATTSANLLKMLGSYDLVIIGGNVYEGNFIEQINVLSDSDRLLSRMTGANAEAVTGSTGGNLLLNAARINNVGGMGDLAPLTSDMAKLVSTIASRGSIDDPQLGADLGFLGHSDIRVLYLTGNVYEMNVVSQMNVLDDSDTVLHAGSPARNFVAAAGPEASWSITTGKNALVNSATITDVDDAGFKRFMDGQYYSSSMLVQADLVARGQDVISFDPNKLASELVAFVHDDPLPQSFHDSMHSVLHHDAPAEGVGGMLS